MGAPHTVEYRDSIGGLIRGILGDLRDLVREELTLARAELREQAGRARLAAISLGAACTALTLGAVFLLIAAALGVAHALQLPMWAGFLSIAALLCTVGTVALAIGRRRLQDVHAVPVETVRTLKENSAWIAKRLSSAQK